MFICVLTSSWMALLTQCFLCTQDMCMLLILTVAHIPCKCIDDRMAWWYRSSLHSNIPSIPCLHLLLELPLQHDLQLFLLLQFYHLCAIPIHKYFWFRKVYHWSILISTSYVITSTNCFLIFTPLILFFESFVNTP